jgi:hypothetical protein
MQLKTFIIVSCIVSGAMLAALFVLQAIMRGVAEHWVNQDTELNTAQKILIGVAAFWLRFWWLAGALCDRRSVFVCGSDSNSTACIC